MQDTTQMLPEHEGVQQSGQNEGGQDRLEDAGAASPQATDWEAGASGRDAPSLPLSTASRCPGGINTRFLPLISCRGAGGGTGHRGGEKKPQTSGKKNSFPATEEKDKVWIH